MGSTDPGESEDQRMLKTMVEIMLNLGNTFVANNDRDYESNQPDRSRAVRRRGDPIP